MADITTPTNTTTAEETELFAAFIDAIGRPIADLKIKLNMGDEQLELLTDENGALPIIDFQGQKKKGNMLVTLPTGKEEVALKFDLAFGMNCYLCESPYILVPGKTFRHEGTPTKNKVVDIKPAGTENDVRSDNGNPVKQVTTQDCPNTDNLKLYPNQQYKPFILKAAQHADLIPQGVAALINTEAGKIVRQIEKPVVDKKGKPVLSKDGKPKTKTVPLHTKEWLPTSTNSRSTARGLTQFLTGTWKDLATKKGSYLSTKALDRGYVQERGGKRKKLVITNEQKLLAMREEPEISIMVSMDYGVQNFKGLLEEKFNLSKINDSEKAKLIYLAHHLGLGDAVDFIRNDINENHAKFIFAQQIGMELAEKRAKLEIKNSYVLAHRRWLIEFIDGNIYPPNFACISSKIDNPKKLFDLIVSIGGNHPEKFRI